MVGESSLFSDESSEVESRRLASEEEVAASSVCTFLAKNLGIGSEDAAGEA